MRWKKPFIVGAITTATLILAAWLLLSTLDFNRFKPRIIQVVKENTGLELALHGNIEVSLGLNPRFLIHDVAIRNATWGSRPDMITIKRCEGSLALVRLIRGVVEIERLSFIEPDFLLETDATGALNFLSLARERVTPSRQSEAATHRAPILPARTVRIENGRFTYRDGRTGVTYLKSVSRLTMAAPNMKSPIQIAMEGFLNGRPVELEGNLGTPSGLIKAQGPWPVNLTAKVDGTVAHIQGVIGDVARFSDLSLRIRAEGPSVSKILALAGIPKLVDPGPFALTATLTDPGSIPALIDVDLRIGSQDRVEIKVGGAIENLRSMQGVLFDVTALIKGLSYLSRDAAKPQADTGPLIITGSVRDSAPKTLSVQDLRITGGNDSLSGSLEVDWSGKKARTKLKLSAQALQLQNLVVSERVDTTLIRPLQRIGPADLTLSIADPFGRAVVEEVDLHLGEPEQIEIRVGGRIKDVFAMQGIELSFNAHGKDAAGLEKLLGKPIPMRGPYAVSGHVTDLADKEFVCHDLNLTLGKSEAAGLLELNLAGDKPQLSATFFSEKLDLESAMHWQPENREIPKVLHALGPIRLAVSILDPWGKPAVPEIHARMGTSELAEVNIKGAIQDVLSPRGIDLDLAVQGKEFGRLHQIFRKSLPLKGPFSLSGRVLDPELGVYRLEKLEAILGRNAIHGWAEARVEDPVRIDVKIAAQDIYLNDLSLIDGTRAEMLEHIGPWSLETRAAFFRDRLVVESFKTFLGAQDIAEAMLTGAIEDLFTWQGVDLAFSLRGNDLARVEKFTGEPFPLSGPFALTGRLVDPKAGMYKVQSFNAVFGDNDLEGAFELVLSTPRPRLAADLSSRTLDLRPLVVKPEQGPETKAEQGERKKSGAKIFPLDPLRLDALQVIDADVKLQAGQILLPRLAFDNVTVHMGSDNGHLQIRSLQGAIGGGTADGRFSLKSEGATAKAELEFKASEVDLGAMLAELGVEKSVEGILRAEIEAQAQGASIGELMAGLNGRAVFVLADGRIYNKYIDLLGGSLLREVYRLMNPFSQKEAFSELTCHVNHFEIKEGLAVSKIWVTDTRHTTVRGAGEIDLGKEKMDMAFRMSPKKSIGISGVAEIDLKLGDFARSFKVGGTFAQPSVTLNPTGAAATIGKMLGGLALFGPFGLAAGLIDLKLGQDHPCLKALEAMESGPGAEGDQNTGTSPPNSPLQTLDQHQGH